MTTNNVLVLKGWVVAIIDDLEETWKKTTINNLNAFISKNNINIITWDGDLLQIDSFTKIIPGLIDSNPHLKIIIFKKETSYHKLFSDHNEVDEYNNKMEGFSFIISENTRVLNYRDDLIINNNYDKKNSITIVKISEDSVLNEKGKTDYLKLGLSGYIYLKNKVANEVFVARIGEGGFAKKENNELMSLNPLYPIVKFIDIPTTRQFPGKDIEIFP